MTLFHVRAGAGASPVPGEASARGADTSPGAPPAAPRIRLGARLDPALSAARFEVYSENATRIELWLYDAALEADEVDRIVLARGEDGVWAAEVPLARLPRSSDGLAVYYGFRAWGPNWPYRPEWHKGSEIGFECDVDDQGNRFNPNKLLLDPFAVEISHDPKPRPSHIDPNEVVDDYYSGAGVRQLDTGRIAPKSVLPLRAVNEATGPKPACLLENDVIYEVHVRGLTRLDPSIPEELRGTYRGAGMKAAYLRRLGVTAVQLLPVFHFASEQNDDGDPRGDNYWGYMTLGYFAPCRRYAADRSPGGPTREFRAMVRAFHDAGIKVLLDVVYNHTGEGLLRRKDESDRSRGEDSLQDPSRGCILCLRGLDNATFYTLRSRPDLDNGRLNQRYVDNTGCGANLNVAHPRVRDFLLASLEYWVHDMGVDGFRFDLAPVLGNRQRSGWFEFDSNDPDGLLQQMGRRLPLRTQNTPDGVDLIAEPWALGDRTYQLGHFPGGWAEWNDVYRTAVRDAENKLWVHDIPPHRISSAVAGSSQVFRQRVPADSARPANSVNYVASHDGFTLRDVFSWTDDDQHGWDHYQDPSRQRKAVRNAFALLMTSAGVPMFMGGDELLRSLGGRKNTVAIDDESVYLRWENVNAYIRATDAGDSAQVAALREGEDVRMFEYVRALIELRRQHDCLRRTAYFAGRDESGSGLKDITWCGRDGSEFGADWSDSMIHFLGFRLDSAKNQARTGVRSLYVAYSWHDQFQIIGLPPDLPGTRWFRYVDTAEWFEPSCNVDVAQTRVGADYGLHERSVAIFLEK